MQYNILGTLLKFFLPYFEFLRTSPCSVLYNELCSQTMRMTERNGVLWLCLTRFSFQRICPSSGNCGAARRYSYSLTSKDCQSTMTSRLIPPRKIQIMRSQFGCVLHFAIPTISYEKSIRIIIIDGL